MLPPVKFLTFILMMWHLGLDANVIIYETGVDVGDNCFECGEQLLLSCQIDSYSISMSWQNDSSSVPFAQCLFDTCTLDTDVANNFVFSTNTSTGTFNLTFTVSIYNNGTSYMCSDGAMTKTSLVLTKDYRPTFNNTIPGQLKAMSGCVNKDVIVQFTWKQENGGKCGKVEDVTPLEEEISCLLDTECGAADSIKHARTIEVEQGGASDQRLKVIVSYNGFRVDSFLTEERYICNGICVWDNNDNIYLALMIVFLVIDVILYVVFSISIFCKESENNDSFGYTNTDCDCLCDAFIVAYIVTICSWIPLLVTVIMSFLEFNPGPGELDGKCKAWIIVGSIEIVWLIVHVVSGAIAIVYIRNERKGTGAVSFDLKTFLTDKKCVKSMYFINLPIVFFLLCFCIYQEVNTGPGHEQANFDLEIQSENGSSLPQSSTLKDTNRRFTANQNREIDDVINGLFVLKSSHQPEQNIARERAQPIKKDKDIPKVPRGEMSSQQTENNIEGERAQPIKKGKDLPKISHGEMSRNDTMAKHVYVKPTQQHVQAGATVIKGRFRRGLSAVNNSDLQYDVQSAD